MGVLNEVKAIWLCSPKEVTDEEYTKFYRSLAKDFGDEKPLAWSHFSAEGDVEFKAVLYMPPRAPGDPYESYYNANKSNLKLYVRRVFISDEFDELLPKYPSFLMGLVDSDTLPLNVSREMLRQHSSMKTVKKKLIRKAFGQVLKWATVVGNSSFGVWASSPESLFLNALTKMNVRRTWQLFSVMTSVMIASL